MPMPLRCGGWLLSSTPRPRRPDRRGATRRGTDRRPPARISQDLPESDFLFNRPRFILSVRGAVLMPSENSDLFSV